MQLSHKIQDSAIRDRIAADCTQLIDTQVAAKGGLGGMALKAAYGAVKGIGGDYIPGAVKRLMPEIFTALDPLWAEGVQTGDPVNYLSENSDRTADVILSTTDARIERKASGGIIGNTYKKLRNSVKRDVAEAVPGLALIIDKHINS
ncbi:MAG: hypothetical protein HC800_23045 [Phormidesmis sp. RL_2_1]|nr:hypothetical protein [Phormidesmis sp. RL_2_1]